MVDYLSRTVEQLVKRDSEHNVVVPQPAILRFATPLSMKQRVIYYNSKSNNNRNNNRLPSCVKKSKIYSIKAEIFHYVTDGFRRDVVAINLQIYQSRIK